MCLHEDRLIETLLEEELGNHRCPDLTDRIMARIQGRPNTTWFSRLPMAAGVAAALALTATLIILLTSASHRPETAVGKPPQAPPLPAYPPPSAEGDYLVSGGGGLQRGSVVHTANGQARLRLGGYVTTRLSANTSVQIEGENRNESVRLIHGQLNCKVQKGIGKFTVHSDVGAVHVLGTEFEIKLNSRGDLPMNGKQLIVSVLSGAVMLSTQAGEQVVRAEQTARTDGQAIHVVAQADERREREQPRKGSERWYKQRLHEMETVIRKLRAENEELRHLLKKHRGEADRRHGDRGDRPRPEGREAHPEGDRKGGREFHVGDGKHKPRGEHPREGDGAPRAPKPRHDEHEEAKPDRPNHELSLKERLEAAIAKHKAEQEKGEQDAPKPKAEAEAEPDKPRHTRRTPIAGPTRGFFGKIIGTVVKKAPGGILVHVESVKPWPKNRAVKPQAVVGHNIGLIAPTGEGRGHFLEIIHKLKVGQRVVAEGLHRGGTDLTLIEHLQPLEHEGDRKHERRKEGDGDRRREVDRR